MVFGGSEYNNNNKNDINNKNTQFHENVYKLNFFLTAN